MQQRLIGWLASLLLLIGCLAPASAAEQPAGSLFIAGGALRFDNQPVWNRFVELAGGKGAKVAVFASAAGNPKKSAEATMNAIRAAGGEPFFVPVAVRLKDVDWKQTVADPVWIEQVRKAGGIYFTGGAQERITQVLYTADGQRSAMLDAIWEVYRKGGVIGGSSAGAAIMSTTMFRDAMDVLSTLKMGVTDSKEIDRGLGFVGPDVFIDQHFLARGRFARVLPVMLKKGYKLALGVDENTVMVVKGKEVEVIGYKGALVVDLAQASTQADKADFNIRNVKLSYLDRGDRFDMGSKTVTPAAAKLKDLKVDPNAPKFDPFFTGGRFSGDILGNTVLIDIMSHLVDSDQPSLTGLAFGAPDSVKPELGFEFKFRKGPDTLAWYTGSYGGEDYTILNVYLDIVPFEFKQPFYRYR